MCYSGHRHFCQTLILSNFLQQITSVFSLTKRQFTNIDLLLGNLLRNVLISLFLKKNFLYRKSLATSTSLCLEPTQVVAPSEEDDMVKTIFVNTINYLLSTKEKVLTIYSMAWTQFNFPQLLSLSLNKNSSFLINVCCTLNSSLDVF